MTIQLLGHLEAKVLGKEPIRRFRSLSAARTLALLAVNSGRAMSREEIVQAIWPEDEPELARGSLRVVLHSLKKQLDTDSTVSFLGSDGRFVWLNKEHTEVDYDLFQGLSQPPPQETSGQSVIRLQKAIEIANAPLLKDFQDYWLVPHQLAMEETYAKMVVELISELAQMGATNDAISVGRSALKVFPFREEIHVSLKRLLNESGNGSEAIRQFEVLEKWLDEVWGETPSDAAISALNVRQSAKTTPQVKSRKHFLPQNLVGRKEELAKLVSLLSGELSEENRLITLTGFGGVGKTSLARAIASELEEKFTVLFLELASLQQVDQILPRLLDLVGLTLDTDKPFESLRKRLNEGSYILVIDNVEHLLPGAADFVAKLLTEIPGIKVLATSRTLLHLHSEQVFQVGLLQLPVQGMNFQEIASTPSVELFVRRATSVLPTFSLSVSNVEAVAELCRRLEGLALAIEIAATQIRVLSPGQILLKLELGSNWLVSIQKDAPARHYSLDQVTSWSYELLDQETKRAFRFFSVPSASFSIQTAESLTSKGLALEAVTRLIDASLLIRIEEGEQARYTTLVPVREFGLRTLAEANEEAEAWAHYQDFFLEMAIGLHWEFEGPNVHVAAAQFSLESNHFRQVINRAKNSATSAQDAAMIINHIVPFVNLLGQGEEWRKAASDLVSSKQLTEEEVGLLHCAIGSMCIYIGRIAEARESLQIALPIFDRFRCEIDRAGVRNALALSLVCGKDDEECFADEALVLLKEATHLAEDKSRSLYDSRYLNISISSNIAASYRVLKQYDLARSELLTALNRAREVGGTRFIGPLLLAIADNFLDVQNPESAETYARESIVEASKTNTHWVAFQGAHTLSASLALQGKYYEAMKTLRTSYQIADSRRTQPGTATTIYEASSVLYRAGLTKLAKEMLMIARRLGQKPVSNSASWDRGMPEEWFEEICLQSPLSHSDPIISEVLQKSLDSLSTSQ